MASDFVSQVTGILEEYNLAVDKIVKEVLPKVATDAAKQLKGTSPIDEGYYASGWRQKTEQSNLTIESVVYNAKMPGLTQLLEKGHAKRGGGRVPPASEHIKAAEEWVKAETVKRLEDALR